MDLNAFLRLFEPEERERLVFMDGLTKSLGASNIRNCHVIANQEMVKFIVSRRLAWRDPTLFCLRGSHSRLPDGLRKCRPEHHRAHECKPPGTEIFPGGQWLAPHHRPGLLRLYSRSATGCCGAVGRTASHWAPIWRRSMGWRSCRVLSFRVMAASGCAFLMPPLRNEPRAPPSAFWRGWRQCNIVVPAGFLMEASRIYLGGGIYGLQPGAIHR